MFREKLTYANVMATLSVFLVLGGGAYAAAKLPNNSVGTKQLKNGAITLSKLSGATRTALKGATGPQGPAGAPGSPGATKVIVRSAPFFQEGRSVASCQPGEVATGGGGLVEEAEPKAWIWNTTPVQNSGQVPTAWEAEAANVEDIQANVAAYVICASP